MRKGRAGGAVVQRRGVRLPRAAPPIPGAAPALGLAPPYTVRVVSRWRAGALESAARQSLAEERSLRAPDAAPVVVRRAPTPQHIFSRAVGTRSDTGSIQADNGEGLTLGIIGLVNKGQPRKVDDWGVSAGVGLGARAELSIISKPTRQLTPSTSLWKAIPAGAKRPSWRWRTTSDSGRRT